MKLLNGPIPGQSLTGEPKAHPWERPPEISDPKEAIDYHLDRLMDPDRIETAMLALESGIFSLEGFTTFTLRDAVSKGIHSVDVSLIVAPVIHEFLKKTAKATGVKFKETTGKRKLTDKDREKMASVIAQLVSEEEAPAAPVMEEIPLEEEPVMEEVPLEEAPRGLMSRGMK